MGHSTEQRIGFVRIIVVIAVLSSSPVDDVADVMAVGEEFVVDDVETIVGGGGGGAGDPIIQIVSQPAFGHHVRVLSNSISKYNK